MHSSLPQRQDHLRARYRALLEDAWGRAESRDPSSLARTRPERAAAAGGVLGAKPATRVAAET
jgi:hypothetical protein